MARYGPGGSYWANGYLAAVRTERHARCRSSPGRSGTSPISRSTSTRGKRPGTGSNKYAQLVKLSHDAIRSRDPQARIVLAGMLGNGDPLAWDFLKGLYKVPGFKNNFDVAALHPYTGYLDEFRRQILQFRGGDDELTATAPRRCG